MKYRKLGRTGLNVSEIGMGLEHLLDKDEQTVVDTIQAAIRGGVNYFDCHVGHDFNEDSTSYEGYNKLGKALHGSRDNVAISYVTYYKDRTAGFTEPRFDYFLKAVKTTHVDVFMIQFCDKNEDYEQVIGENGALAHAKKLRAEGKAKYIGIATHSLAIAQKAIAAGEFDVLMYPVNPAFDVVTDEEQYKTEDLGTLWNAADDFTAKNKSIPQPRKDVYHECERKNIGLVAMKAFAGGAILEWEKDAGFTPVNLISYALAQNGVSTVVPGCTNPGEINEILEYTTASTAQRDYSAAVVKSRWRVTGNCIYCNHCLPCNANINIGLVNRFVDQAYHNPDTEAIKEKYHVLPVNASACTRCGVCEKRCPFDVKVMDRMKQATELFSE